MTCGQPGVGVSCRPIWERGFVGTDRVDPDVERVLEYVAALPGWYVPASELLDYLAAEVGCEHLTRFERRAMEYAHVLDRVKAHAMGRA